MLRGFPSTLFPHPSTGAPTLGACRTLGCDLALNDLRLEPVKQLADMLFCERWNASHTYLNDEGQVGCFGVGSSVGAKHELSEPFIFCVLPHDTLLIRKSI